MKSFSKYLNPEPKAENKKLCLTEKAWLEAKKKTHENTDEAKILIEQYFPEDKQEDIVPPTIEESVDSVPEVPIQEEVQ